MLLDFLGLHQLGSLSKSFANDLEQVQPRIHLFIEPSSRVDLQTRAAEVAIDAATARNANTEADTNGGETKSRKRAPEEDIVCTRISTEDDGMSFGQMALARGRKYARNFFGMDTKKRQDGSEANVCTTSEKTASAKLLSFSVPPSIGDAKTERPMGGGDPFIRAAVRLTAETLMVEGETIKIPSPVCWSSAGADLACHQGGSPALGWSGERPASSVNPEVSIPGLGVGMSGSSFLVPPSEGDDKTKQKEKEKT